MTLPPLECADALDPDPNDSEDLKIDIHHHIFPPAHLYPKNTLNAKIGWTTPPENLPWTPQKSVEAMNRMGVGCAVLSYPAGLPMAVGRGDAAREENKVAARELNEYAHRVRREGGGRFGWMACLPDLRYTDEALGELKYALDTLQADGISLSSSYGDGSEALYIGDDSFDPIWAELDRREATVFLHGNQTASSTPHPHAFLGIPVVEVPNETFKAAAHLVVTGKKRRFHRVNIILAHLGGSTPFLAPRVAVLSAHMGCKLSPEECIEDFSTFFFDTALAAHESTLGVGMLKPGRLLFGTDFPAISAEMAEWYTGHLEKFYADDDAARRAVMRENALRLFPRLARRMGEDCGERGVPR